MINDALHRLLLDNLTTATILLNAELRLEYMNPAAEMLLAVSGQRSHGQFISELFTESPEALSSLRQAVEHAHPFTKREAMLTSLSGQTITVDYAVTPILSRGQTLLLLEVHPRDRLLRITKEEAQLSKQETTKLLVRGLAHEIKNPLGGIRGAAQLLEHELNNPGLREYTQVIIKEADRLQDLMKRLLSPHRPMQPGPVNIHEILERVRSLLKAEFPQTLTVCRDYDTSLPDLVGDREQLIQAILNIARNAAQAIKAQSSSSPVAGQITLRTRVARQVTLAKKRHRLALEVQVIDNGPGIPDDIRERMFYPLVSGREGGSGLGLTLAQSFVQQHQGTIECESRPGYTCFSIRMPLGGA